MELEDYFRRGSPHAGVLVGDLSERVLVLGVVCPGREQGAAGLGREAPGPEVRRIGREAEGGQRGQDRRPPVGADRGQHLAGERLYGVPGSQGPPGVPAGGRHLAYPVLPLAVAGWRVRGADVDRELHRVLGVVPRFLKTQVAGVLTAVMAVAAGGIYA